MRHGLWLLSCLLLLLVSRQVIGNQFQNGLMLGFILHSK